MIVVGRESSEDSMMTQSGQEENEFVGVGGDQAELGVYLSSSGSRVHILLLKMPQ